MPTNLTPQAFVNKWQHASAKERSAAQEHFIDLCRLLDHPTPMEADPAGATLRPGPRSTAAGRVGRMCGRRGALPGSTRGSTRI